MGDATKQAKEQSITNKVRFSRGKGAIWKVVVNHMKSSLFSNLTISIQAGLVMEGEKLAEDGSIENEKGCGWNRHKKRSKRVT